MSVRKTFLSTLSLRRATAWSASKLGGMSISIHALLAESDSQQPDGATKTTYFYPRSPCGERPVMDNIIFVPGKFLSTLSLRRATNMLTSLFCGCCDFYPRSPCGERPTDVSKRLIEFGFLSTLSLRRATQVKQTYREKISISIHALLAESDDTSGATYRILRAFLSTLSLRRATSAKSAPEDAKRYFYPRSPCGERRGGHISQTRNENFYPRSPCGERPDTLTDDVSTGGFLSTLSLRRATFIFMLPLVLISLFLSTLSLRRATLD